MAESTGFGPGIDKRCGAEILWLRKSDGSYHPPLIAAGEVLVERDGVIVLAPAYIRHRCDPEQAKRYLETESDIAREQQARNERRERNADAWAAEREYRRQERERLAKEYADAKEEAWRVALLVDCPKCPAVKGKPCLNLNDLKSKPITKAKKTSYPHPDRVILGDKEPR